jgi:hypothetical protein
MINAAFSVATSFALMNLEITNDVVLKEFIRS